MFPVSNGHADMLDCVLLGYRVHHDWVNSIMSYVTALAIITTSPRSSSVCVICCAGISEERAAWLLSAIGIANTLGRVVFGFMADLKWVNRLMLYNTALTICGVATALSPFVGGSYELLMTYAAVFGVFIGGSVFRVCLRGVGWDL